MTATVPCELGLCLLALLVGPGLARVPEPAQCLASGVLDVIRLPQCKDTWSCWKDCFDRSDCHMAAVIPTLGGSGPCLLLNCLNQSQHPYPRDLTQQIMVFPKSTIDDGRRSSRFLQIQKMLLSET